MKNISYYYLNRGHYTSLIIKKFSKYFWKLINLISISWWDVKIGTGSIFFGKVCFYRLQDSEITIGNNCKFCSSTTSNLSGLNTPCMITTARKGAKIIIGDNCGFSGTRIRAGETITIGNNVRCGANTYIASTDVHTGDYRANKDEPIVIEDNVWLGLNVVVLKGVHIGENSVIGANSVVTKDIPANSIAVGIPCRVIKQIDPKLKPKGIEHLAHSF